MKKATKLFLLCINWIFYGSINWFAFLSDLSIGLLRKSKFLFPFVRDFLGVSTNSHNSIVWALYIILDKRSFRKMQSSKDFDQRKCIYKLFRVANPSFRSLDFIWWYLFYVCNSWPWMWYFILWIESTIYLFERHIFQ